MKSPFLLLCLFAFLPSISQAGELCDEAAIDWAIRFEDNPDCLRSTATILSSERPSPNAFHVTVQYQCGTKTRKMWVPLAIYNGVCQFNGE